MNTRANYRAMVSPSALELVEKPPIRAVGNDPIGGIKPASRSRSE
jgi:hypothetical protein